jgi:hypothetical protein
MGGGWWVVGDGHGGWWARRVAGTAGGGHAGWRARLWRTLTYHPWRSGCRAARQARLRSGGRTAEPARPSLEAPSTRLAPSTFTVPAERTSYRPPPEVPHSPTTRHPPPITHHRPVAFAPTTMTLK